MSYPKINSSCDNVVSNDRHTILFIDLDGTMVKHPFEIEIMSTVYEKISEEKGIDGHRVKQIIRDEEHMRVKAGRFDRYDFDDIVRTVAKRLGIQWNIDLSEKIRSADIPSTLLYPHVKETLEELKKKKYTMYLATNGLYRYQNPILEKLDLKKYFDDVITPDKVGCHKDSFGYFKKYLFDGFPAIMIGDEYISDIYYPKKFGLKTVWIRRPGTANEAIDWWLPVKEHIEKADAIVQEIDEIPTTLDLILSNEPKNRIIEECVKAKASK